jgi:hypothetical protein
MPWNYMRNAPPGKCGLPCVVSWEEFTLRERPMIFLTQLSYAFYIECSNGMMLNFGGAPVANLAQSYEG